MGKLSRFLGYSAYMGNKRRLDELLGRKDMYENQIKKRFGDWKVCLACIPEIDAKITELRAKVAIEDAN